MMRSQFSKIATTGLSKAKSIFPIFIFFAIGLIFPNELIAQNKIQTSNSPGTLSNLKEGVSPLIITKQHYKDHISIFKEKKHALTIQKKEYEKIRFLNNGRQKSQIRHSSLHQISKPAEKYVKLGANLVLQTRQILAPDARVAGAEDPLVYQILHQSYDKQLDKFENVSLSSFLYESQHRKYKYVCTIDQNEQILDTLRYEYFDYDEHEEILLNYREYRIIDNQLLKVKDWEDYFIDQNGNATYRKFYEANMYFDIGTNTSRIGAEKSHIKDAYGRMIEEKTVEYHPDGSQKSGLETIYSYDNFNNLVTQRIQEYNEITSQWTTTALIQKEYNSANFQVLNSYLSFELDGSLIDSYRILNNFMDDGTLILDEMQTFDPLEAIWKTMNRSKWNYNASGQLIFENYTSYDTNGNTDYGFEVKYEYNASGQLVFHSVVDYSTVDSKWLMNYAEQYEYNINNDTTLVVKAFFMTDSTYESGEKFTYLYNGGGLLESKEYALIDNGVFTNVDRYEYVYSGNSPSTVFTKYWDVPTKAWHNYLKSDYTYVADITEINKQIWDVQNNLYEDYLYCSIETSIDANNNRRKIIQGDQLIIGQFEHASLDTTIYLGMSDKVIYHTMYLWSDQSEQYTLTSYGKYSYNTEGEMLYSESYSTDIGGTIESYSYNASGLETEYLSLFSIDTNPEDGIAWILSYWLKYEYDQQERMILNQFFTPGYGYRYVSAFDHPQHEEQTRDDYYETTDQDYLSEVLWNLKRSEYIIYNPSGKITDQATWNDIDGGEKWQYTYNPAGLLVLDEALTTSDLMAGNGIAWRVDHEDRYEYNQNNRLVRFTQRTFSQTMNVLVNKFKTEYLYDPQGNQIQTDDFVWGNNAWQNTSRKSFSYNNANLLTFSSTSLKDEDQWVPLDSTLYAYDDFLNLSVKTYLEYSQDEILHGERWLYRYKPSGYNTYCSIQITGDTVLVNSTTEIQAQIENPQSYAWTDALGIELSNTNTLQTGTAGMYIINAISDVCISRDTIKIYEMCTVSISGEMALRLGETILLTGQLENTPEAEYIWYNSHGDELNQDQTLMVEVPDTYTLIAYGGTCYGSQNHDVAAITSSLEKQAYDHELVIYPNPNKGLISISTDEKAGISKVEVLDFKGNIVHCFAPLNENQSNHVELRLPSNLIGFFFLRVYGDDEIIIRKILIE